MNSAIKTDVLVIGSGLGGLAAAWEAAKRGCQVTLLTRTHDPKDSNTNWAQGGIIYRGHDEQPEQLVADILSAGAGLSSPEAAFLLSMEGPRLVKEVLIDENTGKISSILAKETILATGGLRSVFLHTTNPPGARGDGIAMAYRAGARCINLQYVQFHPTALFAPDGCFLISETVRGEGGTLVDRHGKEFMQKFHPAGSLAPRDVAARAIYQTMLETGEPCVYLDITHKPAEQLLERFPGIYAVCIERGIDMTKDPIPVVPAAHYSCGGIATDVWGRTSVDRLRAAGEVACTGLHGANRLASTSLLECLVWGTRAGQQACERIRSGEDFYFPQIADWRYEKEPADPALISQDWLTIQHTMWNYVGLIRSEKRLNRAKRVLQELDLEIARFYEKCEISDSIIGLRNGILTALLIQDAADQARESRGCHYRID